MPMIYRRGLQEDLMDLFRHRMRRQTGSDLAKWCFCAKDNSSGDILGVSWWDINENPLQTRADIDEQYEQTCQRRANEPAVEGMDHELGEAYFKVSFYSEMETVAGQPYMTLRMLAVHPEYHRRGAGSLLLEHGLEMADRPGLTVYLDCGVCGKPLYERHCFVIKGDFPLKRLDYGGRSDGRHWLMMRPVKGGP